VKLTFPKYDAALVEEIEAYLDQPYQTEIVDESDPDRDGLITTVARGFTSTGQPGSRGSNHYARPMFQVIVQGAFSGWPLTGTPCQCGNFAYSWNCPEHDELPWDTKSRRWIRPQSAEPRRPTAFWSPTAPTGLIDAYQDIVNASPPLATGGIVDRPSFWTMITEDPDARVSPRAGDIVRHIQQRLANLPPATIHITFDVEQELSFDAANRVANIQIETEGGDRRGR
jgi:hypothetical protein